jgi:hypothetical protein
MFTYFYLHILLKSEKLIRSSSVLYKGVSQYESVGIVSGIVVYI